MKLNHASLFSGIGGFDLAAEWMGWENMFHCEWNEFGKKVLKHYWPNAESFNDITKTDFRKYANKIDILTGGFPCQPYSTAGKRKGKDDDRHLWPEMLRAIREIAPRYVVGENVAGLLSWNGGLVFDEVQADLEAEGYEVQPVLLPAAGVGAPHRRDRIWFIAYANECTAGPSRTSGKAESNGSKNNDEQSSRGQQTEQHIGCSDVLRTDTDTTSEGLERRIGESVQRGGYGLANGSKKQATSNPNSDGQQRSNGKDEKQPNKAGKYAQHDLEQINAPNTECKRQQEQGQPKRSVHTKTDSEWKASWAYDDGRWPTQSPLCGGNDGISERLDGITFSKWRNESIKAYGNAIVPNVALQIFKAIEQMEIFKNETPKKN